MDFFESLETLQQSENNEIKSEPNISPQSNNIDDIFGMQADPAPVSATNAVPDTGDTGVNGDIGDICWESPVTPDNNVMSQDLPTNNNTQTESLTLEIVKKVTVTTVMSF